MDFGRRLKELRLERNMTQTQLGALFNVHYTTVRDWELRGCEPSYQNLIEIAKFFEVSTDYLLGLSDE